MGYKPGDSKVTMQIYAGQLAAQISELLRIKDMLREVLLSDGYDNADEIADRIYENAWKYVQEQAE